MQAMKNPW
jgi:hypothetical protein